MLLAIVWQVWWIAAVIAVVLGAAFVAAIQNEMDKERKAIDEQVADKLIAEIRQMRRAAGLPTS